MLEFSNISNLITDDYKKQLYLKDCDYIFHHVSIEIMMTGLELSKRYTQYNAVCAWCNENFNSQYRSVVLEINGANSGGYRYEIYFGFDSDDKAVAFKLRWC